MADGSELQYPGDTTEVNVINRRCTISFAGKKRDAQGNLLFKN
jgi:hypothetical protein